ncbi:RING-H2 finger protein ATL43 [Durio zibethinus]|uniref:RING-type E3 ubiquitin transferase n=1 Tax=Durio zibethinus TaxID=66656 RepID=A0A6P5XK61_DURZI|nr:RING-H2 finger protein ATL43 [Durio zibethinus]
MGVFYPLTFLFILFLLVVRIPPLLADNYNNNNSNSNNIVVDNITASNPSPSPSLQQIRPNPSSSPFKPSIAVIVGVLTTLFSITFLLLLYAKHCGRNNNNPFSYTHASSLVSGSVSERKNSGINRVVVESLPLFRFSSLRGQKDGLECAVCLTRFEPNELLRLLPKCKHAFHVECVDTWLDAHSTCPLCRYRVDPEDILLIEEDYSSRQNQDLAAPVSSSPCFESNTEYESSRTRRVSGRHSYAGERGASSSKATTWFRRSLDSSGGSAVVGVGGLGYRKDGLLLLREDEKKRLEHRIIVSGSGSGGCTGSGLGSGFHQRWSDVHPSDLLYLRSEMIISQSRRLGTGSLVVEAEAEAKNNNNNISNGHRKEENGSEIESIGVDEIGRSVINSRSVSEITGLSRFSSKVSYSNNNDNNSRRHHHQCRRRERQAAAAGLISRWLAWISSTSHSDVRSQPVDTIAGLP